MKYKLAYIDEDAGWLNTFHHTFNGEFNVVLIQVNSESSIDSIVETIFQHEADGIVTDYLLDETGEVDFNGNNIVDAVRSIKPHFPAIMLTAHEPQAINHTEDVNIINGKDILDGENEPRLEILKVKIKSNIDRYYSLIEDTRLRIEELVQKRNLSSLEPPEEEELTKLFILMDELEPRGKDIPSNLITTGAITRLNEFVFQTKEILEELKKSNK